MRTDEHLQGYLNWFAYLFRIKRQDEKHPKNERLPRHLLLTDAKLTRNCREN